MCQRGPFHCAEHNQSFKRKFCWQRHIDQVHQDERPFVCDICGERLKRRFDLHRHLADQHGLKKVTCSHCHLPVRSDGLSKHMGSDKCHRIGALRAAAMLGMTGMPALPSDGHNHSGSGLTSSPATSASDRSDDMLFSAAPYFPSPPPPPPLPPQASEDWMTVDSLLYHDSQLYPHTAANGPVLSTPNISSLAPYWDSNLDLAGIRPALSSHKDRNLLDTDYPNPLNFAPEQRPSSYQVDTINPALLSHSPVNFADPIDSFGVASDPGIRDIANGGTFLIHRPNDGFSHPRVSLDTVPLTWPDNVPYVMPSHRWHESIELLLAQSADTRCGLVRHMSARHGLQAPHTRQQAWMWTDSICIDDPSSTASPRASLEGFDHDPALTNPRADPFGNPLSRRRTPPRPKTTKSVRPFDVIQVSLRPSKMPESANSGAQRHSSDTAESVRRFVVTSVSTRGPAPGLLALPIRTYSGQGTQKSGITRSSHGVVYTGAGSAPQSTSSRIRMNRMASQTIGFDRNAVSLLEPYSRFDFGDIHAADSACPSSMFVNLSGCEQPQGEQMQAPDYLDTMTCMNEPWSPWSWVMPEITLPKTMVQAWAESNSWQDEDCSQTNGHLGTAPCDIAALPSAFATGDVHPARAGYCVVISGKERCTGLGLTVVLPESIGSGAWSSVTGLLLDVLNALASVALDITTCDYKGAFGTRVGNLTSQSSCQLDSRLAVVY